MRGYIREAGGWQTTLNFVLILVRRPGRCHRCQHVTAIPYERVNILCATGDDEGVMAALLLLYTELELVDAIYIIYDWY